MKIRALKSFSGALSMYEGQETECGDKAVLRDLLQAGYVEEIKPTKKGGDKDDGEPDTNG